MDMSRAEVFSIGLIILSMCSLIDDPEAALINYHHSWDEKILNELIEEASTRYSATLTKAISDMLEIEH